MEVGGMSAIRPTWTDIGVGALAGGIPRLGPQSERSSAWINRDGEVQPPTEREVRVMLFCQASNPDEDLSRGSERRDEGRSWVSRGYHTAACPACAAVVASKITPAAVWASRVRGAPLTRLSIAVALGQHSFHETFVTNSYV